MLEFQTHDPRQWIQQGVSDSVRLIRTFLNNGKTANKISLLDVEGESRDCDFFGRFELWVRQGLEEAISAEKAKKIVQLKAH